MKYQTPELETVGTATELIQGSGSAAQDSDHITRQVKMLSTELECE